MKIACIVVDDEPIARELLETYIDKCPELSLAGSCATALAAFDLLHSEPVQLMFLDVKMPGMNGIEFLSALKHPPKVVFTTAYSEHAHAAFELDAADYLLKPVTYERFLRAIRKVLMTGEGHIPVEKRYTYFRVSGKMLKIDHENLTYVKAVKDYILLRTTTGSHLCHMSMKAVEQLLPAGEFTRTHRSYLINHEHIQEIRNTVLKIAGEEIPLGESYREMVLQKLLSKV
ncbi:LytR/AlgR family response regulator transcription factor [Pedobacter faecalis]|uniref:LytR/AlgR family response regulator transcription factor n=1 Tax=Pedobacter faecalis TaxID=3041495 RepID=UPI00254D4273|nr:LytTR family DNA-binding domain-containing protein [Pedobacter sp. ELA7]